MTLTTNQAAHELLRDKDGGWSYNGALALVEYLEEIDEDMELDVVALRCNYSEHGSLQEWADDYGLSDEDGNGDDDKIREHIQDNGTLIEFDGGIIVSSF